MENTKCERCFHASVCEKKTCMECQSSYCDECELHSLYKDEKLSAENCPHFKDKHLIKVLPCEAGDTIYVPQGGSKFKSLIVDNFIATPDILWIKTVDGCLYDTEDIKNTGILKIKPIEKKSPISFYIATENSSGMKFQTKEAFMSEVSKMVDNCIENGGTQFDIQVDANANCFYQEGNIDKPSIREIAEKIADFYEDFDFYSFRDILEVGETKEDAVEKIITDLMNPQIIDDVINDIENIIGEAESEEDKEKARQLLAKFKNLK